MNRLYLLSDLSLFLSYLFCMSGAVMVEVGVVEKDWRREAVEEFPPKIKLTPWEDSCKRIYTVYGCSVSSKFYPLFFS